MAWKKEYGQRALAKLGKVANAARSREWTEKNPMERARISRRYSWKAHGIINFGIDEYEAMYLSQNGKCAICEREIKLYGSNRNDGDACVDHDHSTGQVRGLLCRRCNLGIGFLGDNAKMVAKALDFLEDHDGGRVRAMRSNARSWDVAFLRGRQFQACEG